MRGGTPGSISMHDGHRMAEKCTGSQTSLSRAVAGVAGVETVSGTGHINDSGLCLLYASSLSWSSLLSGFCGLWRGLNHFQIRDSHARLMHRTAYNCKDTHRSSFDCIFAYRFVRSSIGLGTQACPANVKAWAGVHMI